MKSDRQKSHRARKSFKDAVKGAKPLKKDASYVGELTSGYDATTPGIDADQNQVGKGHQESVHQGGRTDGGAHFDDKRDEVSKAASKVSEAASKVSEKAIQKAAKDLRVSVATLSRMANKLGSYIGDLSSGYDATTPGIDTDQNQVGKGHQESVNKGGKTDGGAHFDDKRDEVSKAASVGMKKLGEALLTLEKEAKEHKLTDVQQSTLADTFKQLGREFDTVLDGANALEGGYKNDVEILVSSGDKRTKKDASEWFSVSASDDDGDWIDVDAAGHPAEDSVDRLHTQFEGRQIDQPSMKAEKWFEPGPGTFEDPRDVAERATSKSTADHTS